MNKQQQCDGYDRRRVIRVTINEHVQASSSLHDRIDGLESGQMLTH